MMQTVPDGPLLVINAGSSSIKYALFDSDLGQLLQGQVDIDAQTPNHGAALAAVFAALDENATPVTALGAAAHRVVHGGTDLSDPVRLNPDHLAQIRACIPLAPLHNPHNLRAIDRIADIAPDLPQYASFDTGFHANNPPEATRYAVPEDWHKSNIRRFGFHGISYQGIVANYPGALPARLLAFHLGNGASACAILNGKSVATTMGFSPLEGLTMGTRSGSIDAAAVLEMATRSSPQEVLETLNHASGLAALSGGISDMKTLTETRTPKARFAIRHFAYWAARHAGSMIAAMGGVDAIAFTGGIGENATHVRGLILKHLGWALVPLTATHVIAADEARQIAANALALMTPDD